MKTNFKILKLIKINIKIISSSKILNTIYSISFASFSVIFSINFKKIHLLFRFL